MEQPLTVSFLFHKILLIDDGIDCTISQVTHTSSATYTTNNAAVM